MNCCFMSHGRRRSCPRTCRSRLRAAPTPTRNAPTTASARVPTGRYREAATPSSCSDSTTTTWAGRPLPTITLRPFDDAPATPGPACCAATSTWSTDVPAELRRVRAQRRRPGGGLQALVSVPARLQLRTGTAAEARGAPGAQPRRRPPAPDRARAAGPGHRRHRPDLARLLGLRFLRGAIPVRPGQASQLLDEAGFPLPAVSDRPGAPPARFRFTCLLPENLQRLGTRRPWRSSAASSASGSTCSSRRSHSVSSVPASAHGSSTPSSST